MRKYKETQVGRLGQYKRRKENILIKVLSYRKQNIKNNLKNKLSI